jgi:hypothetical protein
MSSRSAAGPQAPGEAGRVPGRHVYDAVDGELVETGSYGKFFRERESLRADRVQQSRPCMAQADGAKPSKLKQPEREYDFYGKVVSLDQTSLIVSTKHGIQTFVSDKNTARGATSNRVALVDVYYRRLGNRMSQS